jgi:hypothetical protein
LRSGERVVTEFRASLVELLRIARLGQRRARIVLAAPRLVAVRTSAARDTERPLHLGVVTLELVIGDRPVDQRRSRHIADDAVQSEVAFGEARQPALPVHGPSADHLRHGTEQLGTELAVHFVPNRARVQQRVRPQVVAVDVGEFVAAEGFAGTPRATLQHDNAHPALGEDLGGGGTGRPGPDDADVGPVGLRSVSHDASSLAIGCSRSSAK